MNCVLLVPDGMGLRNFLYSTFLDRFTREDSVVVWHALPASVLPAERRSPRGAAVTFRAFPTQREGLLERVLRQAKIYGQLYRHRETGSAHVLRKLAQTNRVLSSAIGSAARAIGRVAAISDAMLARLDRCHAFVAGRRRRVQQYEAALTSMRTDVVFCTHQRASIAVPAMLAARRAGIPTVTFIYSWDNLPKGRMAVHADHYFVWSDHMRQELHRYYPEVSGDRVHVVGTPQFEPYFSPALIEPKKTFLERLGLDPGRPVICFSGDDLSTSPHDHIYLEDVASALDSIPTERRPQVLFRRCPVDDSNRYDAVLKRYPAIAVSDPLWRASAGADWTGAVPTPEDAALLANLVHHCDLVVNVGSTMAMDFAMADKPGVYLAYEPVAPPPGATWTARGIYELPHLRSVLEQDPVYLVRDRARLADVLMHALSHPGEKTVERRCWLERQVCLPAEQASRRCVDTLRRLANA